MYMSQLAYKTVAFTLILDPRPSHPENVAERALLSISLKTTDRSNDYRALAPRPKISFLRLHKFPSQMRCARSNCIVAPNRRRQVFATLCSYTVIQETLCKGISFSSERVNSVLILCSANVTYKMKFHFFFQHSDLRPS